MKRIILVFFSIFLMCFLCFAEEATDDIQSEEPEEDVIVTVTKTESIKDRVPNKVSIVTREKIEENHYFSVANVLDGENGLRVENNCQNCNFTELRLNGMAGKYTSIVFNGIPSFSSLASVYGLEQLPAEMIGRVEILQGGASTLYGGDAVAGVVNIVPRKPTYNFFKFGSTYKSIGLPNLYKLYGGQGDENWNYTTNPERTCHANETYFSAGFTTKKKKFSAFSYGTFNFRTPYYRDHDDDLSELGELLGFSLGGYLFGNPIDNGELYIAASGMFEDRRGGNKFRSPEHLADVAESIKNLRFTTDFKWDHDFYSKGILDMNYSMYLSNAFHHRDSYYGGGGSAIEDILDTTDDWNEDTNNALAAYGETFGDVFNVGFQYNFIINQTRLQHNIGIGLDYKLDYLNDTLVSRNMEVNQGENVYGGFIQYQLTGYDLFTINLGMRVNGVTSVGTDENDNKNQILYSFPAFAPRVGFALGRFADILTIKGSFAMGYKSPGTFDEDFHITVIEGAGKKTQNADGLQPEYAISTGLTFDFSFWQKKIGLELNGFYNVIFNPFTIEGEEDEDEKYRLRKNSDEPAHIGGGSITFKFSPVKFYTLDLGITGQYGAYQIAQEYGNMYLHEFIRTPFVYGNLDNTFKVKGFVGKLGLKITGPMFVWHEGKDEVYFKTMPFFELNTSIGYTFKFKNNTSLEIFGGLLNILDQFQNDVDIGEDRDAGYVYGPSSPFTIFVGANYKIGDKQ